MVYFMKQKINISKQQDSGIVQNALEREEKKQKTKNRSKETRQKAGGRIQFLTLDIWIYRL